MLFDSECVPFSSIHFRSKGPLFPEYPSIYLPPATASFHADTTRIGASTRQQDYQCMPTLSPGSILPSSFTASMIATQDPSATYQPSFNTPGADAFLSSLEGILHRLLLLVLRKITKFLASSSFTFKPNSNPIPIHAHDAVLEQLLRILSCLAITPWRIFDDLAGVLSPACA